MSSEHFTVDGTLIEAWASLETSKKKDAKDDDDAPPDDPGNPTVDFHGERRSNEAHASATDPEARLARKGRGKEAKLAYSAHALMENRNGLLVDFRVAQANGRAEREVALAMLDERKARRGPATVGADKGYDTHNFVAECRAMNVVPHVAQVINAYRGSAIDARTTRHVGRPGGARSGPAETKSARPIETWSGARAWRESPMTPVFQQPARTGSISRARAHAH